YIESKDEKITILVEEGTPQQSLSLIELLLSELKNTEYHLCHVKKGQLVYCESLIYCTPLWTSLDNTRSLPNPKKEFFVSSDCLKKVKDKLSKNTLSNNYILKNKKIYLQRENTKLR
ncbi:glycosyltransferase family 61 protein, partial [Vibrio sp. 10N.222.48.A3]